MRKLKVDLSELALAFETGSPEMEHFLDLETGDIVMVTEDDSRVVSDFEDEVDLEGCEDPKAEFEKWLKDQDHPDWQEESIHQAFLVEAEFGKRFIRVPEQESRDGYNDMVAFAEDIEDKHLRELLFVALDGKGAFRRFKDVLLDYPDDRERWFRFSEERVTGRILDWLESEEIEVEQ
jgi:hypothetical protein